MNKKRSDKANHWAALIAGIALLLTGYAPAMVLGIVLLATAAVYWRKMERGGA